HSIYWAGEALAHADWLARHHDRARPTAAVLFYRAHWLSGNTAFVDAIVEALLEQGFNALPIFTYSLREQVNGRPVIFDLFCTEDGKRLPDVVISTLSFALGKAPL